MRIERINLYRILLPFTGDFSISRLKGVSSNTVVAEIIANSGEVKGYGEGLPVRFVTGETPEGVVRDIRAFTRLDSFPWDLEDVSQIWGFVEGLSNGKGHNAAICAIETALLDVLGKYQQRPVIEYLPQDFRTESVCYGAAIPIGDKERVTEICRVIKTLGTRHLRIKMDSNYEQNRDAVETVVSIFGYDCDLRVDPNGVWDRDLAFKHIPLIKDYKVKVVEEPLPRNDRAFEEFAEIIISNDITLMACESAPTLGDVKRIAMDGYYTMINVKLCRSGGFRRSFEIINYIRERGLSFQIGCTLGESGILSAAGRALCLLCRDAKYYDGSYDRFILKDNVTVRDVSFGHGGEAGPLNGPGLGVEVDCRSLNRLSVNSGPEIILRPKP